MNKLLYYKKNRHATWLELFFDLIFVVLIGKTTHILSHTHTGHIDLKTLAKFILIFVPIWWIWSHHTVYNNIYDEDSKIQRIITLIIMFLVISMSMFIHTDFQKGQFGFILIFSIIRLFLGVLYLKFTKNHLDCRKYSLKRGQVYLIGMVVGLVSLFLPNPYSYFVFYTSIFIEFMLINFLATKMKHIEIHTEHLLERTGLLTLILMGESIIGIVGVLEEVSLDFKVVVGALSGFIMIGSFWWIYFDSFESLEKSKRLKAPYTILISHLLLCIGLAILANVIKESILDKLDFNSYKLLLALGLLLFYISKQITYGVAFPKVIKYQVFNILVVGLLTVILLIFIKEKYILLFCSTIVMFIYIILNNYLVVNNRHIKEVKK